MSLAALQIIEEEFMKANRNRVGDHTFTVDEVMNLKTAVDLRIFYELVDIPEEIRLRKEKES